MDAQLARAVVAGDLQRLRALLQSRRDHVQETDAGGDTLVHHALGCEEWQPQVVEALLEAGVPLNARNHTGDTTLARAVVAGCAAEAIRFLCSRGADPNIADEHGWTPLMKCIASDWDTDLESIQALLEAGALVEQPAADGTTALSLATERAAYAEGEILQLFARRSGTGYNR